MVLVLVVGIFENARLNIKAITEAEAQIKLAMIKAVPSYEEIFNFMDDWYVNDRGSSGHTVNLSELAQSLHKMMVGRIK